jgi:hypothetical protein
MRPDEKREGGLSTERLCYVELRELSRRCNKDVKRQLKLERPGGDGNGRLGGERSDAGFKGLRFARSQGALLQRGAI